MEYLDFFTFSPLPPFFYELRRLYTLAIKGVCKYSLPCYCYRVQKFRHHQGLLPWMRYFLLLPLLLFLFIFCFSSTFLDCTANCWKQNSLIRILGYAGFILLTLYEQHFWVFFLWSYNWYSFPHIALTCGQKFAVSLQLATIMELFDAWLTNI